MLLAANITRYLLSFDSWQVPTIDEDFDRVVEEISINQALHPDATEEPRDSLLDFQER